MVQITEMRIVLPVTLEEFKRGQRYGNWKTNMDNTEEGQGGTLLSSSPYFDEVYGEGVFTHTLYRLGNRLPDWVTRLVPANALIVDEKSWMTFPFMKSILTIPFFSKLKIEIVTLHLPDDGSTHNALGLSPDELAIRKIDMVDIGSDPVAKRDYKKHLDPSLVRPKKLQRGPLTEGWQQREKPLMCAYKVVRAEANYWGVSSRAERLMISAMRQIFTLAHKNCFCYADEWYDMTYNEVMALERNSRDLLKELAKRKPDAAAATSPSTEDPSDKENPAAGQHLSPPLHKASGTGAPPTDSLTAPPPLLKAEALGANLEARPADALDTSSDAEEAMERMGSVDEDDDSDDSMGVEFFEAEMEWVLQEELSAEGSFSGMGSGRASWSRHVPASCPVCDAAGRQSETTLFCEDCKEFYCAACFPQFHTTPRLRAHRRHRVTPVEGMPPSADLAASGPLRLASSGTGPLNGFRGDPTGGVSDSDSASSPAAVPSAKTKKDKKSKKTKKARDTWSTEFRLTPEEKDEKNSGGSSGRLASPGTPPPGRGHRGARWEKANPPPLNVGGVENGAGEGPVATGGAMADEQREASWGTAVESFAGRPVELSQEMVRSIAAIYKRLAGLDPPLSPSGPPPLSRQTCTGALPGVEDAAELLAQSLLKSSPAFEASSKEKKGADPYGVHQEITDAAIGPYAKMMEVKAMQGSQESLAAEAVAFCRFMRLAEQLVDVDASRLSHGERVAFWLNIYNAIVMHAYLAYGVPRNHYKRIMLMQKAAYVVGGLVFRILAIEHNVLRSVSHHPALAAVLPVQRYKPSDERQACVLSSPEPLISFALSCGARSAPAVRIYSAEHIHQELEVAAREYLQAAVGFAKNQKILIPKILQWYGKDFAKDTKGLLQWIVHRLPENEQSMLLDRLAKKSKSASKVTQVVPYEWGFRYLFAIVELA